MSRFTQYVGLKPEAREFLENRNAKEIASWVMTCGIGMEDVRGSIYEVPPMEVEPGEMPNFQPETYVEVEDKTPWSSGPVIHTCLMLLPSGKRFFEWKEDELCSRT